MVHWLMRNYVCVDITSCDTYDIHLPTANVCKDKRERLPERNPVRAFGMEIGRRRKLAPRAAPTLFTDQTLARLVLGVRQAATGSY